MRETLAAGKMLTPNLRLLKLLGRGGMGSVWLAEHLGLARHVAVKLLASDLNDHAEARLRFTREATLLAQVRSPHVVEVHDVGESDGTPYFVMELLEGEDLSTGLDRSKRLTLGVVTAIVAQLCKALEKMHEIGVVHRDLKPANVFLTRSEGDLVVKLVDFGVAKDAAASFRATSTGAFLGTPLYMSPEQVLSPKDVGPASDLYSLGVLTYESLAGEPPFGGETLGALSVAITRGEYAPITSVVTDLHPALDAWFAKALAAQPTQRFESARAMAAAFLRASRGESLADPERYPPSASLATERRALDQASPAARSSSSGLRSSPIAPIAIGLGLAAALIAALVALTIGWFAGRDPTHSARVFTPVSDGSPASSQRQPPIPATPPSAAPAPPATAPQADTPSPSSAAPAPSRSAPRTVQTARSRKDRGF